MKNILCVGAHYDDIEIGMGGTCLKLVENNCNLYFITLCNIDVPNRPEPCDTRKQAFLDNCKTIGVKSTKFLELPSNGLQHENENFIISEMNSVITANNIDTVFTQNGTDINIDHQIASRATRVSCRPRVDNTVNELYEYFIPGSSDWSFVDFHPNVAIDISKHFETKLQMIERYQTEIRCTPDPVSSEKIISRDSHYGSVFGYDKAEIFNLIFKRW